MSGRIEIHRIAGDIYLNGRMEIFAVDKGKSADVSYINVDWLIGWAKIGLMSEGYEVPHFSTGDVQDMQPQRRDTSALPASTEAVSK